MNFNQWWRHFGAQDVDQAERGLTPSVALVNFNEGLNELLLFPVASQWSSSEVQHWICQYLATSRSDCECWHVNWNNLSFGHFREPLAGHLQSEACHLKFVQEEFSVGMSNFFFLPIYGGRCTYTCSSDHDQSTCHCSRIPVVCSYIIKLCSINSRFLLQCL